MATITVKASSRGKVPSCYVGQTFQVEHVDRPGDLAPTLRPESGNIKTWDRWVGKMPSGRKVEFVRFASRPGSIIVNREGFVRGTWIYEFEITED